MDRAAHLVPALAFLLAAVPLADLLDRLGFFDAVAARLARRSPDGVSVGMLWLLAAATTAVLNLDTTIVLLTPLYVRLARRSAVDETALAVVPLLLASLASSVLPVSNLTTLIALETWSVGTGDVVARTGLPSVAAVAVGWWGYRRRHPSGLAPEPSPSAGPDAAERRAWHVGSLVVGALLVGFVVGPSFGVAPWVVTLVADIVLAGVLRSIPWRRVPLATAVAVGAVGLLVVSTVGDTVADAVTGPGGERSAVALAGVAAAGGVAANLVNNLPALVAGVGTGSTPTWAGWAWLLGVNVGAVVLPWGALANLLWLRIMRVEGVEVGLRRYVAEVAPVALPAFAAAVAVLVAQAALLR